MKTTVMFLLCISSLFATCYFDSNFGMVRCIEVQNTIINSTPRHSYTITNMTPYIQKMKMEQGLVDVANGARTIKGLNQSEAKIILDKWQGKKDVPILWNETKANISIITNKTVLPAIKPKRTEEQCKSAMERDWQWYCASMWSQGIELDCTNANVKAKAEILSNIQNSSGSWYGKCLRGE